MARRKEPREIGEDTGLGIDIDGDGKSDFSISLKTIGMLLVGKTLIGMWFTLQSDIQEKLAPAPVIERMEFDMKDELIRQTIMDTQEDVDEIKEKLDKIDERLYEIQKNN